MNHLTFSDIAFLFCRQRKIFFLSFSAVMLLTVAFTITWSRYRAEATIEIERPNVASNVTNISDSDIPSPLALADRRINQIQQRVTSTESLSEIIRELDLYPHADDANATEANAQRMRKKILLTFVSSPVSNNAVAHREAIDQLSATAFTLRFEHYDPTLAKAGLDALVKRFVAQELAQRKEQAQATIHFIDAELETLESTIDAQEKKVADFRARYGESGPSAVLMNQQATMSNIMNLQNIESQLATNTAAIGTLRGQLAATEPYLPIVDRGETLHSPSGQLKSLQAQLATISGRYGTSHPDVVKLNEQISALKKQGYSAKQGTVRSDADNPVYLQIAAQLSAMEAQQKALRAQQENLLAMQAKYAEEIAKNPHLEQELSKLTLDLDQSKERYHKLRDKKLSAEMKLKLDSSTNADQLRVISPVIEPSHTAPRRLLIFVIGSMFAVLFGLLCVTLKEMAIPTVRSASHLTQIIGVPPMITLPNLPSTPR